jgi:Tol biopolymer transport system component
MIGGRCRVRLQAKISLSALALVAALATLACVVAAPARATIAYEKNSGSFHPSIWVAEANGGSPRQLVGGTGGNQPLIAPDGSAVIFQSLPAHGNAALEMVSTAGGASVVLAAQEASMNNTAWSPDSKTIATTRGLTPEREQLVLIDVATRSARVIATGTIQGVSFSPDSTRLAYARAPNLKTFPTFSDIYTVPLAGGSPTRITRNHRSTEPVWGPAKIAFARTFKARGRREDAPKSNVWLMNPDGSQARQLTRQKAAFLLSGPAPLAWSASGAQLLAQFGGQDTVYGEGVNPLTGAVHTFSAKKSIALQLVAAGISRDGSTVLAATGGFDPGSGHNIVSVPFAGGPITTLVRNAFAPTWND